MTRYDYKIAANWNNSAGLANLESISVSGGEDLHTLLGRLAANTYYLAHTLQPFAINYELTTSGASSQRGFTKVILNFPVIGAKSYDYLETTYGQGNSTYRGKVTIRLRSGDFNTYANYNGILALAPPPRPFYRGADFWYQDVQATILIKGVAS